MPDLEDIVQKVTLTGHDDVIESFGEIGKAGVDALERIAVSAEHSGSSFAGLIEGVAGVAAAFAALQGTAFLWAEKSSAAVHSLEILAQEAGESAEEISALENAIASLGGSADGLQTAFRRMGSTITRTWEQVKKDIASSTDTMIQDSLKVEKAEQALFRARDARDKAMGGAGRSPAELQAEKQKEATTSLQEAEENLHLAYKKQQEDRLNSPKRYIQAVEDVIKGEKTAAEASKTANLSTENIVKGLTANTEGAAEALEHFNGNLNSIVGEGPKVQQVFFNLADYIKNSGNAAQNSALLMRLMGRTMGVEMLPVLSQGRDALEKQIAQMKDWGLVIDEDGIKKGNAFHQAYNALSSAIGTTTQKLGLFLAPIYTDRMKDFTRYIGENQPAIMKWGETMATKVKPYIDGFFDSLKGLGAAMTGEQLGPEDAGADRWQKRFEAIGRGLERVKDIVLGTIRTIKNEINSIFGTDLTSGEIALGAFLAFKALGGRMGKAFKDAFLVAGSFGLYELIKGGKGSQPFSGTPGAAPGEGAPGGVLEAAPKTESSPLTDAATGLGLFGAYQVGKWAIPTVARGVWAGLVGGAIAKFAPGWAAKILAEAPKAAAVAVEAAAPTVARAPLAIPAEIAALRGVAPSIIGEGATPIAGAAPAAASRFGLGRILGALGGFLGPAGALLGMTEEAGGDTTERMMDRLGKHLQANRINAEQYAEAQKLIAEELKKVHEEMDKGEVVAGKYGEAVDEALMKASKRFDEYLKKQHEVTKADAAKTEQQKKDTKLDLDAEERRRRLETHGVRGVPGAFDSEENRRLLREREAMGGPGVRFAEPGTGDPFSEAFGKLKSGKKLDEGDIRALEKRGIIVPPATKEIPTPRPRPPEPPPAAAPPVAAPPPAAPPEPIVVVKPEEVEPLPTPGIGTRRTGRPTLKMLREALEPPPEFIGPVAPPKERFSIEELLRDAPPPITNRPPLPPFDEQFPESLKKMSKQVDEATDALGRLTTRVSALRPKSEEEKPKPADYKPPPETLRAEPPEVKPPGPKIVVVPAAQPVKPAEPPPPPEGPKIVRVGDDSQTTIVRRYVPGHEPKRLQPDREPDQPESDRGDGFVWDPNQKRYVPRDQLTPKYRDIRYEEEEPEEEETYAAGGGAVSGFGSGTSDNVPIMASVGEFVVKADGSNLDAAIRHFGGYQQGGEITRRREQQRREQEEQQEQLKREQRERDRREREREHERRRQQEKARQAAAKAGRQGTDGGGTEVTITTTGGRTGSGLSEAGRRYKEQEKGRRATEEYGRRTGAPPGYGGDPFNFPYDPFTYVPPEPGDPYRGGPDYAQGGIIQGFASGGLIGALSGAAGGSYAEGGPVLSSIMSGLTQQFSRLAGGGEFSELLANSASTNALVDQVTAQFGSQLTGPLGYHQLDLRTDSHNFPVMITPTTMEQLQGSALAAKLTQTGQRPSWFS